VHRIRAGLGDLGYIGNAAEFRGVDRFANANLLNRIKRLK
jgi:hypothetical protein